MRCFLAIGLTDPVRDALTRLQQQIPVGRVVPAGNLHVTLGFLGEQDDEALTSLDQELACIRQDPFTLSIRGLDVFGGDRPTVLFAGIDRTAALDHLHQQVRGAIRRAGIFLKRDRYRPHVTLARFGAGARGADRAALQTFLSVHAGFQGPDLTVAGFGLYRSTLRPEGALYEEMVDYPLSGWG